MLSGNHLRQQTVCESVINAFRFLCVTKPKILFCLTEHLQRIKDDKCSGVYHRKQVRRNVSGLYTVNQKGNTVGIFPLEKKAGITMMTKIVKLDMYICM